MTQIHPPSLSETSETKHHALDEGGLEVLMKLVREGKVDPWNVDIAQVADFYLKEIEEQQKKLGETQAFRPEQEKANVLKLSGKTLLYLAILLRMKSDLLVGLDPFAPIYEDADLGWEGDGPDFIDDHIALQERNSAMRNIPIKSLDEVLERRTSVKQKRIRAVTLEDLVRELKKFELLERERAAQAKLRRMDERRQRSVRDYADLTTEEITELAHAEFQEDTVDWVKSVIDRHLVEDSARLNFHTLVKEASLTRVEVFLSLLFLEARHEVEVFQNILYSDELVIQRASAEPLVTETQ